MTVNVEALEIPGAFAFTPRVFSDERGRFFAGDVVDCARANEEKNKESCEKSRHANILRFLPGVGVAVSSNG